MNQEVEDLNNTVSILLAKVESLRAQVVDLTHQVDILTKENRYLRNRLLKYENPKNSNNSSVPPSKDENRSKRGNLRERSGLKPGGQKGRKGNTLKMVETPDSIHNHIPNYCTCCGKSLDNIESVFAGKRQVYDIPKIEIKVKQHQIYSKQCSCGHVNKGSYPTEANSAVSYGNNIESLIGYFHTRQYLPFKRMQELFKDVFGTQISEGGIHYILDKLVAKSQPAYDLIKQRLASSTKYAVGSDETGIRVNGHKHWAWTWQNDEATFITITDNRAQRSIEKTFKNGFKKAVLVHDCWASHFNTPAVSHQICIAHLLRDINYLNELYGHKWSMAIKLVFQLALRLKSQMNKVDYYIENKRRLQIEKRLDYLLSLNLPEEKKELIRFKKRLNKYRNYLFVFLYRQEVPPDNNASERAIRNVKIKQKVSTQFRSPEGAARFAILRSVTDTVLKNGLGVLGALNFIANFETD
jgi:transposase